MTDCEKISDKLTDYINRRLTREENSEIVIHLAACPGCRKEAAALFKIRDLEQSELADVPGDIAHSAFDKLPPKESALNKILNSGSCYMAFDLIEYSLTAAAQTIQLASKTI